MKRIALFLSLAALSIGLASCGGSTETKTNETDQVKITQSAKVVVYYFHSKQRCKTCLTIQEVAAATVEENFAGNANVKFVELDFTEKANEALAEKYEVANSSLFIVSESEHLNLTSLAFANAVKNPDVLKEAITNEVNNFLNE